MPTPTTILDLHANVGPLPYGGGDPEELLRSMDRYGIARSVLAPADAWQAVANREGNDAIIGWVRRWPDRFLGYATANPWYGTAALAELERALDAGLIGIHLNPARQGFVVLEPVADPIFALAERRGVPVYVVTGFPAASMPLQVVEIARRHPGAGLIMGRSGRGDFGLMDLIPGVQMAPNIYVETCYNLPSSLEAFLRVIDPGRILFASDWPYNNLDLEFEKLALLQAPETVRAAIMGSNLAELLCLR